METPTPVTPPVGNKIEAFVLDVVGFLTKLDPATIESDYSNVMIGVADLKKIIAALQELDQLKNGTISNTNT